MPVDADLVVDARTQLGEGPTWDERDASLVWVDITGRRLHRFRPSGGEHTTIELPVAASTAVPRRSGGLVLAAGRRFLAIDHEGRIDRLASLDPSAAPRTVLNDGKCDRAGRLWAGTRSADGETASGALFRLAPGSQPVPVVDGVTISNGLGWSPDDSTMFYIDSTTHRVDRFTYEPTTGTITDRRPFVTVADADGLPDGMAVDAAGCVWVALWGGWCVRRYSPVGALDLDVRVAAAHVTSCSFGGPDLTDLYITTARAGLSDEQLRDQPHAGGVFRVHAGTEGLPSATFAG